MEQFANNFSLPTSKKKNGRKCKALHKEEISKNGILLIVLSDEEAKDVTSLSKENEDNIVWAFTIVINFYLSYCK